MLKLIIETNTLSQSICRGWTVVEAGRSHRRKVNGILGLLCREHYPGVVRHQGVDEPAETFAHYYDATDDQPDLEGRTFPNKAVRVLTELWVSVSPSCHHYIFIHIYAGFVHF